MNALAQGSEALDPNMINTERDPRGKLNILHCFRSPVGGIFRHVRDLIEEQTDEGHRVGLICDNNTGGPFEEDMLAALASKLELGLVRVPMERSIGLGDLAVTWRLYKTMRGLDIDILHAHGAKGGAYARIIGTMLGLRGKRPARLYCPHGGSIHYDQKRLSGRVYFQLEQILERFTERLIFVSEYERDGYFSKVGEARCAHSLVRNGVREEEFRPVETEPEATDFLYVGMMRDLKGVDLFLDALPIVATKQGRTVSATLIGDGPDLERYKCHAKELGKQVQTRFLSPIPARDAFKKGQSLVVPSRAESMPYIVLEALAAKRPLIATRVGGIPEIYAEHSGALVEPDNLHGLATAMSGQLDGSRHLPDSCILQEQVKARFSTKVMAQDVMRAYRLALGEIIHS